MGIFEDILGRSRPDYQPVDAAFPELTPPVDEAAAAEEARQKAGERLIRTNRRRPLNPLTAAPDAQSAGVQLEMNDAPAGTGVPFSTQAGMLAPPVTVGDSPAPIPIPLPRPPGADAPRDIPSDISAQGRPAPPAAPMPIAPQVPPAAPQQAPDPFGLPSILSNLRTTLGNNSNTLLALGAGLAGAPNIGQGISRAAAAAIPARAADIKQTLEREYRGYGVKALKDAGVPLQQAIAAQGDPELKKALIQNYIVDRKHELKTVKDWMGNESLVDFDPFTSKAKPVTFDSAGGGDAPGIASSGIMAAARMEPNYDPTTHRDEAFLEAVRKADPLTASAVEDVAEGKMPATGRNLQKIMPLVSRYEHGFEANRYSARQNLEKSYYGGGEGAKQLRSANTVIDHGIDLKKAIDDLHNYSMLPGYLNKATGMLAENMGDKKYQDALARFKANANVYAKELETALTGKTTRGGTKEIEALFDAYAAPTTNQAALQQTLGMLEKRVGEHEHTYRSGMNKPNHTFDTDMLTNRSKLDNLLSGDTGSGAKEAKQAKPVVTFKPGGHYKMVDGVLVEK